MKHFPSGNYPNDEEDTGETNGQNGTEWMRNGDQTRLWSYSSPRIYPGQKDT